MIEQLQMILTTLGDLGQYAVWVVMAFFLWKLLTLASVLYTIKFGIQRLFEVIKTAIEKPEPEVKNIVDIGSRFITHDSTPEMFLSLSEEMRGLDTKDSPYVHTGDIQLAMKIIKDYKNNREAEKAE